MREKENSKNNNYLIFIVLFFFKSLLLIYVFVYFSLVFLTQFQCMIFHLLLINLVLLSFNSSTYICLFGSHL